MVLQLVDFILKIHMEGEGEKKCNGVGGAIHLLSEDVLSVSEQITRKVIRIERGWKVGNRKIRKRINERVGS